ncbi:MAG: TetR/AcrR family transcriptional regulator [Spirochaetes bacterium]|nr:TetR/AcrR family transcriptional regulator [Spirochaetota bacterium]
MTKKESRDKRVQDLLDAAVSEFVEKGYENTSMESIAARAGLTKGGLYYHFRSKDEVLVRANERFMEPVMAMMERASGARSAAQGLRSYITDYITYWTDRPRESIFIFLTMTKAMSNPSLWEPYRGYLEGMVAYFQGLYRRGIETGEFREFNAQCVARAMLASLDGMVGYLVMDSSISREGTIGDFIYTFVESYRRQ